MNKTYANELSNDLLSELNITVKLNNAKMINFDDIAKENITEHNPDLSQIPDHPYKILISGGSGSGKTNSIFSLVNRQANIDKIYLYAKDTYEAKNQLIIN